MTVGALRPRAGDRRSTGGCRAARARAAPPRAGGPSARASGSAASATQLLVARREARPAAPRARRIALTNASANVRPRPSASPTARISAPSGARRARELLEVEPRRLDRHVVERRLERRRRLAGDVVRQLVERVADREQRRELRDREAGRLRGERRGARDARVHLDHAELARSRGGPRTGRSPRRSRRRRRGRSRTPPRGAAGRSGSGRVCCGAIVHESPVWTPIGSRFSIEQTTTALPRASHITSSSCSCQPLQVLLDEHLADRARRRGRARSTPRSSCRRAGDPAARAAERERRPDDRRQREVDVGRVRDDAARRRDADAVDGRAEELAVLGAPDRARGRRRSARSPSGSAARPPG